MRFCKGKETRKETKYDTESRGRGTRGEIFTLRVTASPRLRVMEIFTVHRSPFTVHGLILIHCTATSEIKLSIDPTTKRIR